MITVNRMCDSHFGYKFPIKNQLTQLFLTYERLLKYLLLILQQSLLPRMRTFWKLSIPPNYTPTPYWLKVDVSEEFFVILHYLSVTAHSLNEY